MAKRPRPSKPNTDPDTNGPPAHTDPRWADFWRMRGWIVPDRSVWNEPFHDRRLFLYASSLREKFGFVRYVGLPTQGGPEDTPIEALYVEPALSAERIDPSRPTEDWPESVALIDAVIDHPRLVILGDPGSGKSTLVSWIVLSLLSREENRLKKAVGPLVPITLVLRDLNIVGEITWEKLLARFVAHPTGQALGSAGAIEGLLKSGQAMVLVDGLDEAGGTSTRKAVVAALHKAFQRHQSVRWVVTSRVVGYEEAPVEELVVEAMRPRRSLLTVAQDEAGFEVERGSEHASDPFVQAMAAESRNRDPRVMQGASRAYVAPFDDARIGMFIRNWYAQHETDRAERSARSAELLAKLERSDPVRRLARVPNMLTLIALVYRVFVHFPDGRADLYARIAQAYLESIDTARRLPTSGHSLADMKRWLGYVALQMKLARFGPDSESGEESGILVSRDQLTTWLSHAMAKGLKVEEPKFRDTAAAFVDWVARRAGLIIPRSEDLFAFTHLSFQEYFAAWFIAEQVQDAAWLDGDGEPLPLAAGTDRASLVAYTRDTRWHETFVLMFEILAERGRWSNTALKALFAPTDDSAWSAELDSDDTHDEGMRRASLLVQIVLDRYSGVSPEFRAQAFRRAWLAVDAAGRRMRDAHSYERIALAGRLLEPLGDQASPALAALAHPPRPFALEVLVLDAGATDAVAAQLAKSHAALGSLAVLNLGGAPLTDAGAAALAAEDSSLKALTSLILHDTQITDAGAAALAAKDSGLKALIALDLGNNQITDAGAAALAAKDSGLKALTWLNLSYTQITDAGAAALAAKDSGLKALTSLHLYNNQITDAGAAALAAKDSGLKALTWLDLSYTQITDAGAAALAAKDSGLKALTSLNLFDTQITDAGAAALAAKDSGLKALTSLDLFGTQITDVGAAALAAEDSGLKALTTLDLGSTQITDAGAAALAAEDSGLKALTTLDLRSTQITDAGAAALAAKDSGLKALTTLDLRRTKITDAGAAALAARDSCLKALTTLDLRSTQITDAGAAAIRKAHPKLKVMC